MAGAARQPAVGHDPVAYYEDVELGWRFWLLGHEVWSSPRSIVYHKHHGTADRLAAAPRVRLYERNSLRMLYTHLERETLERVLPAALLLAADRALLETGLSRASAEGEEAGPATPAARRTRALGALKARVVSALRARGVSRRRSAAANLRRLGLRGVAGVARDLAAGPQAPSGASRKDYQIERGAAGLALDGRVESFPSTAAATLAGLQELLESLPELSMRRRWLQQSRMRSDAEILRRFGMRWLSPGAAARQPEHEVLHGILLDAFGIAEQRSRWMRADG